jgi:aspartokinase
MEGKKLETLVMKFGGTSVGTPESMAQTAAIVKTQRTSTPRVVAVTSALSGVTDLLLNSATAATRGDLETSQQAVQAIRSKHQAILKALVEDPAAREKVRVRSAC